MLLKDLKFERFPVYIHWQNPTGVGGVWEGHRIVISADEYEYVTCQNLYDKCPGGNPDDEEITERNKSNQILVLHWEYLDEVGTPIASNNCICIGPPMRCCPKHGKE